MSNLYIAFTPLQRYNEEVFFSFRPSVRAKKAHFITIN